MTELDQQQFETAIQDSAPSVVDFWAEWCMPCKLFAPVLEEVSDEMDGSANFYKVDIDAQMNLAQAHSIASIPTLVVFKDGKEVDRMVGVRTKKDVVEVVSQYL